LKLPLYNIQKNSL